MDFRVVSTTSVSPLLRRSSPQITFATSEYLLSLSPRLLSDEETEAQLGAVACLGS